MSKIQDRYDGICKRENLNPFTCRPCVSAIWKREDVTCGMVPEVLILPVSVYFEMFALNIPNAEGYSFERVDLVGVFDEVKREFVNLKSHHMLFNSEDISEFVKAELEEVD